MLQNLKVKQKYFSVYFSVTSFAIFFVIGISVLICQNLFHLSEKIRESLDTKYTDEIAQNMNRLSIFIFVIFAFSSFSSWCFEVKFLHISMILIALISLFYLIIFIRAIKKHSCSILFLCLDKKEDLIGFSKIVALYLGGNFSHIYFEVFGVLFSCLAFSVLFLIQKNLYLFLLCCLGIILNIFTGKMPAFFIACILIFSFLDKFGFTLFFLVVLLVSLSRFIFDKAIPEYNDKQQVLLDKMEEAKNLIQQNEFVQLLM